MKYCINCRYKEDDGYEHICKSPHLMYKNPVTGPKLRLSRCITERKYEVGEMGAETCGLKAKYFAPKLDPKLKTGALIMVPYTNKPTPNYCVMGVIFLLVIICIASIAIFVPTRANADTIHQIINPPTPTTIIECEE